MKKIFEIPTITKVNFGLKDQNICATVNSGVTTDSGILSNATSSSTSSMLGK